MEDMGPNATRLHAKYEELKAKGLIDCKVWIENPASTDMEKLCGEMLDILAAYERKDFVDIREKLDEHTVEE